MAMEVRLPAPKLQELKELIQQWLGKRSCTTKELESLIGKLGHAAQVVQPGKTFLHRMFELKSKMSQSRTRIRLNAGIRSDILWWATFMDAWNGVRMLGDGTQRNSAHHVWTDASGGFGCGGWNPTTGEWIQLEWSGVHRPPGADGGGIAWKELVPIVLACAVWGRQWSGGTVTFHCDNTAAVSVVNSGYSQVPELMHLLRCLFFIRAYFQVEAWAVHTPGSENGVADAISRNHMCRFYSQVPAARVHRTLIPPALVALLIEQQPDWTSPTWARLFGNCFRLA